MLGGDFNPVWSLLSSVDTFIQCADFYPVLAFGVESFIQCREFISSVMTFTHNGDFYTLRRLLSSVETFYPVKRLLFNVDIFIQCGDFYSV